MLPDTDHLSNAQLQNDVVIAMDIVMCRQKLYMETVNALQTTSTKPSLLLLIIVLI